MQLYTLSGKPVHPIGIGTWGIGGEWEAVYDRDEAYVEAIRYSIGKGQNHIDTGQVYGAGHTHDIIGIALENLKREDLYIGDKIWETSVAKGKVRPAVEDMLKKLGTDYIDLLCVHKPWEDWPWRDAIPQIDKLIDEGIVRHIGASNLDVDLLQETIRISRHPIVVNHLHFNIINREAINKKMITICDNEDIQIVAYKPLERGAVLQNKTVDAIAKKHKAQPSQVALAWLLNKRVFVIPKSTNKRFIDQNFTSFKLRLSKADIEQLDMITRPTNN